MFYRTSLCTLSKVNRSFAYFSSRYSKYGVLCKYVWLLWTFLFKIAHHKLCSTWWQKERRLTLFRPLQVYLEQILCLEIRFWHFCGFSLKSRTLEILSTNNRYFHSKMGMIWQQQRKAPSSCHRLPSPLKLSFGAEIVIFWGRFDIFSFCPSIMRWALVKQKVLISQ